MPFGDVWQEFLNRTNTAQDYLAQVKKYEEEVLRKRV